MSALSDTSAPWRIAPRDTNRRVVDASGHSVAVASPRGNGHKDEAFANARLIAAAPDLLATLRDMDRWLANTNHDTDHPWRMSIREAIAKAEGA